MGGGGERRANRVSSLVQGMNRAPPKHSAGPLAFSACSHPMQWRPGCSTVAFASWKLLNGR